MQSQSLQNLFRAPWKWMWLGTLDTQREIQGRNSLHKYLSEFVKSKQDQIWIILLLECQLSFHVTLLGDQIHKVRERLQYNKFGPITIFIISHLFNDKQGFKKDWNKVEKIMIVIPYMAVSRMIPSPFKKVNREICSLTKTPAPSIDPHVWYTFSNEKQKVKISILDVFKRKLFETGILDRASNFIANTRRQRLLSNYNFSRSKWAGWCSVKKFIHFDAL